MSQTHSDTHTPAHWLDLMLKIAQAQSLRLAEPSEPPYMFDGYECSATVRGGMSLIILGRDPELERKVALKLWQTSGAAAEAALIAEAKMLAKLSHPNVVTVYGVGKCEGSLYIAMEYVEGQDGHTWMQDPLTWQEIRAVFIDAGNGLAAAHDAGIQHRDFKPANMLIGRDGRTRVADFGVADTLRSVGADELLAETVGTPEYMAPERLRGERGDARSDQFSFCVSMWKAIHGRRPYAGKTPAELLASIEAGVIRSEDPEVRVPAWLDAVVRKGLAADPEGRFADMHELVAALVEGAGDERVVDGAGASGHDRVRLALVSSGVAVAALVFALTLVTIVLMRERDRAPVEGSTTKTEPVRETTREPLGVTPEFVIELVEAGEIDRPAQLWEAEVEHRTAFAIAVHADSIRVGEAFLKQARRLADEGRIGDAKKAAAKAKGFAFVAVQDLARYQEPVDVGTDLLAKVDGFIDGLRDRI